LLSPVGRLIPFCGDYELASHHNGTIHSNGCILATAFFMVALSYNNIATCRRKLASHAKTPERK
jgi:hypothetical protein